MNYIQERITVTLEIWLHRQRTFREYTIDVFKEADGSFHALRCYISVPRGYCNMHLSDGWRLGRNSEEKARNRLALLLGVKEGMYPVLQKQKETTDNKGNRKVVRRTPYNPKGVPAKTVKVVAVYEPARETTPENANSL
jgi:hypothetical protein